VFVGPLVAASRPASLARGTTSARSFAFGASTPAYRVRWKRGGGTIAQIRARKSSSVSTTARVPSRHGLRNAYSTQPSSRSVSRSSAIGGLVT